MTQKLHKWFLVCLVGILAVLFVATYLVTTGGNEGWKISADERQRLAVAAAEGDGEAAMRLSNYYLSFGKDRSLALRWREVAALAGNKNALESVGSLLRSEGLQSYRTSVGRTNSVREAKLEELLKQHSLGL